MEDVYTEFLNLYRLNNQPYKQRVFAGPKQEFVLDPMFNKPKDEFIETDLFGTDDKS